jgi:hypothetical protein
MSGSSASSPKSPPRMPASRMPELAATTGPFQVSGKAARSMGRQIVVQVRDIVEGHGRIVRGLAIGPIELAAVGTKVVVEIHAQDLLDECSRSADADKQPILEGMCTPNRGYFRVRVSDARAWNPDASSSKHPRLGM